MKAREGKNNRRKYGQNYEQDGFKLPTYESTIRKVNGGQIYSGCHAHNLTRYSNVLC